MKVNRQNLKWLVQILMTLVLMYLALRKVDFSALVLSLKGIKLELLLPVPALLGLDLLLNSLRVKSLYTYYGAETKLKDVFLIKLHGLFFSLFFPLLGDAYKIHAFKNEHGISYIKNTLVVFLDRLIFTFGLTVILVPVWLFSVIKVHPYLKLAIVILLLIELAAIALLNSPKLLDLLRTLMEKARIRLKLPAFSMGKKRGYALEIIKNTLVAIMRHVIDAVFYLTIAYAVMHSGGFSILLFMFCVFSITLARVIPVSISGIGLREYIALMTFPQIGISRETGFSIAFLISSIYIFQGLLGGISYLFIRVRKNLARK